MRVALLVVVALVLTALVPLGLRRRVLCPLSVFVGLGAGAAWAVVVALA
jgi:hypothetical protein